MCWPRGSFGEVSLSAEPDLSLAYADLWRQLETQAVVWHACHGRVVSKRQCGRGQTLRACAKPAYLAPGKKNRHGDEVATGFFGVSLQHARYFKQLRRLQALKQQSARATISYQAELNMQDTWRAVRHAPGFGLGFVAWWAEQQLAPQCSQGLPLSCPPSDILAVMFDSFNGFVRKYEAQLAHSRYSFAKRRRESSLNFVFQDCRADPLPQADTLIDRVEAGVEEVREDEQSVVLTIPIQLIPGVPVVAQGKVLQILHHEADQLWVEDVSGLQPGMAITQEHAVLTDEAILAKFREVWEPRWNKIQHAAEGQWDQISAFIEQHLRPIQWKHEPWTPERFSKAVARKKKWAARGPDGVAQPDLAALPISGCREKVENGSSWPIQLARGFVTSLAKQPDAQAVDQFRPVTVYSLGYRIWSSERAGEALQSLSQVVPDSVQGGLPARQAKTIWYSVAQELERAYMDGLPLHGVLVDIRKCFNAIPRMPLWTALHRLGFPVPVLRAWAAFVSGQARHFRVRGSVGAPLYSCTGLPEGCALSVFGMVILDWLLDLWLQQVEVPPTLPGFH